VRRQSIDVSAPSARPTRAAIPLPDFVEPMKATLVDSMPTGSWLFEIKLDGYRALALRGGNQTRILSRNQKDLGKKFQIIADTL
jgi:bifunctional non-homologous end joining protein LigD